MLPEKINKVVVFDTETSGFPAQNKPHDDPSQAVAVQLSAKLFVRQEDGSYTREGAVYTVLEDQGVAISPKAQEVHGKSAEMCADYGVAPENAFWMFSDMCHSADVIVAHNIKFDTKIALSTAARAGMTFDDDDLFPKEKLFCTMLSSMQLVKARKANGQIKWPSLEEAMQFFFGRGVGESRMVFDLTDCPCCADNELLEQTKGAHDADVDVDSCAEIFFELLRRMEK